jgi:cytoskeletal protein RodZ
MNARKYVIVAGTAAGISLAVGVAIAWMMAKTEEQTQPSALVSQQPVSSLQKPAQFGGSAYPEAGGTNVALRPVQLTNAIKILAASGAPQVSSAAGRSSNPTYQQAQMAPEVKEAEAALVAAEKHTADVMEKAMNEMYGGISFDAFQKVRNLPEVQQARALVAEAQRRYSDAKSKAMEDRSTK